jgi:hypothetical protein
MCDDRAMAQAVSRLPLTAETQVRAGVIPGETCGGQSGTRTGFSPSSLVSFDNVIPICLSAVLYHLGNEQKAR